ncbi:MAG: vitamin B12 dependent-methionine synthase activation domain-containing protein [Thermoproteota archaeon]
MRNQRGDALSIEVVDHMPIEFVMEELLRSIRVGRLRDRDREIETLVDKSRGLIEPRAVYAFTRVMDIQGDEVLLEGGHTLKSVVLGDILTRGQEVVPYVVTIGPKLEEEASQLGASSVFGAFVLEKVGDYAVSKASIQVRRRVESRLGGRVSGFGPGTGSGKLFDIEQQRVLFSILNPLENIGVRLTPSYLMVPRKSVSGVFAVTPNKYVACQYCPREGCEGRRRSFLGEYIPIRCRDTD